MRWDYPHFTKEEMQCKCGCGGLPKPELMERLEALRTEFEAALIITSGYRCPRYNTIISETGPNGPHTYGLAADIKVFGEKAHRLLAAAVEVGFTGIGVKQKGDYSRRIIHVDCIPETDLSHPRPWVWSY